MKAFLYLIRFYLTKRSSYPTAVKEFIVYGPSKKTINVTAAKIFSRYRQSLDKPCRYHETEGPLPVDSFLRGKGSKKSINWKSIKRRRTAQEQKRPRNQSNSVFHELRKEGQLLAPAEYRKILRDYISDALSTQKREGSAKKLLFVGSPWDDEEKARSGKAVIIEASGLQESAYLCDLIFLGKKSAVTLVTWCVPIFGTDD